MGFILPFFSAIFYYFSFPNYTAGYFVFFSLIPFFYALSKSVSIKQSATIGFIWGFTLAVQYSIPLFYALITEYELSLVFSSLLIFFSSFIPYGIIYACFAISYKFFFKNTGLFFPFIVSSLWVLIDYMMSITPVFMPWGFAGYTQVFNTIIQISDITGIYGVTFLIILINLMFTEILFSKKNYNKISVSIILTLFIISFAYSHFRINHILKIIELSKSKQINIGIIQGNFNSKEKWDSKNTAAIINTYLSMTRQIINNSDIIVWPETVLNSNDNTNLEIISGISSIMREKQVFITGATRNNANKTFNSIFTSDNRGLQYIYDKRILFPFTETSFAGFSSGKFVDSPSVFDIGKTKPVYRSELLNIGFTICFEAIYPDYVRKIKNSGGEVLVNVANDSWFGKNTYEPYMHFYANISRAIENRFYVIRSSNSGISAVISPAGEIVDSIELNTRNSLTTSIPQVKITAFYSKSGNWFIVLSLMTIIVSLAYQLKNDI